MCVNFVCDSKDDIPSSQQVESHGAEENTSSMPAGAMDGMHLASAWDMEELVKSFIGTCCLASITYQLKKKKKKNQLSLSSDPYAPSTAPYDPNALAGAYVPPLTPACKADRRG